MKHDNFIGHCKALFPQKLWNGLQVCLGVSRGTAGNLINGSVRPRMRHLEAMVLYANTHIDEQIKARDALLREITERKKRGTDDY